MLENDIPGGAGSVTGPKRHALKHGAVSSRSQTSSWKTSKLAESQIASSSDYMQQSRENFVSYKVFVSSYWSHLPQVFTRRLGEKAIVCAGIAAIIAKLDPILAFGELIGVIEGSEDAVGTKDRCLDRESYKSLSGRSQANFSDKRDELYDVFVAYSKLKGQRGDYDAADR